MERPPSDRGIKHRRFRIIFLESIGKYDLPVRGDSRGLKFRGDFDDESKEVSIPDRVN